MTEAMKNDVMLREQINQIENQYLGSMISYVKYKNQTLKLLQQISSPTPYETIILHRLIALNKKD